MAQSQRILLLFVLWLDYSMSALSREPDLGPVQHLPIPPELQGLWAKGHRCNNPKRQLHITAHTMQFGEKRPVKSYYSPADPVIPYAGIIQDIDDPGWTPAESALTYEHYQGFLFEYGNDKSLEQLYFRCPAQKPRR